MNYLVLYYYYYYFTTTTGTVSMCASHCVSVMRYERVLGDEAVCIAGISGDIKSNKIPRIVPCSEWWLYYNTKTRHVMCSTNRSALWPWGHPVRGINWYPRRTINALLCRLTTAANQIGISAVRCGAHARTRVCKRNSLTPRRTFLL